MDYRMKYRIIARKANDRLDIVILENELVSTIAKLVESGWTIQGLYPTAKNLS